LPGSIAGAAGSEPDAGLFARLRIGPEFHDEDDVRYLLRHLDIGTYEQAVAVITRHYPIERFPQKTLDALAELLPPQPRSPTVTLENLRRVIREPRAFAALQGDMTTVDPALESIHHVGEA
jgi:hypothetical protein